jgi:hypothetical protein
VVTEGKGYCLWILDFIDIPPQGLLKICTSLGKYAI